jgi:hypothetical protein
MLKGVAYLALVCLIALTSCQAAVSTTLTAAGAQ